MDFKKFKNSLNYAIDGLFAAASKENSFKIQVVAALAVIILGVLKGLELWKWSVIFLTIGIILSLELINTAFEKMIDILVKEHHPHIKYVKDILAAAVLIYSIIALIIAIIIFIL
jgi:diacylglycerol kinase